MEEDADEEDEDKHEEKHEEKHQEEHEENDQEDKRRTRAMRTTSGWNLTCRARPASMRTRKGPAARVWRVHA